MPFHLLRKHLGYKHIDMTMKYAELHPSYNDLAPRLRQLCTPSADARMEGAQPGSTTEL